MGHHRRWLADARLAVGDDGPPAAAAVLIPARHALAVALAALAVAAGAFSWYLLSPGEPSKPSRSSAEARFVAELRNRPTPASLRRTSDDDLVALGERFCQALRERGSTLSVLFEDQLAGRVYEGQTEVVSAAREHLCPAVPDRDRSR